MVFPFEKQAMNGEPVPDDLTFPEKTLFIALRGLYSQYKTGYISRETATRDKQKLIDQYNYAVFAWGLMEIHASMNKRIEREKNAFRRDKTIESAEKLVDALDGFLKEDQGND